MELHIEEDSGRGFLPQQDKSPVSEGGLYKVSLTKIRLQRVFLAHDNQSRPDL
jgi:hypothetical protein